jgi:HAD superfamily hydrolase (TIGR01450 family)
MTQNDVPSVTVAELISRYDVLLVDAYGVLVTHDGVLPGARRFVDHLHAAHKPFTILTNDASRSPERSAARYQKLGLAIDAEQIVTSGMLLAPYFQTHGLQGARCVVLGPEDSLEYVRAAGGRLVEAATADDADVIVICDERGFSLLHTLDRLLTLLYRKLDAGEPMHLIVPNPDLVYPAGDHRYGFTAGAIALLFEEALRFRYPDRDDLGFVRLGKPHAAIFEEALRRSGTRNMVMIGDQLATDIRGALEFGIDSALVTTGLTRVRETGCGAGRFAPGARPTYLLGSLAVE